MAPTTHLETTLVGHAVHLSSRDIAIAHRRSFIHFGRDARRGSITFLQMGGRKVVQICGIYESSSFERSERSSNTYCLLAVAVQLTSLEPQTLYRPGTREVKTTGEDRERE